MFEEKTMELLVFIDIEALKKNIYNTKTKNKKKQH